GTPSTAAGLPRSIVVSVNDVLVIRSPRVSRWNGPIALIAPALGSSSGGVSVLSRTSWSSLNTSTTARSTAYQTGSGAAAAGPLHDVPGRPGGRRPGDQRTRWDRTDDHARRRGRPVIRLRDGVPVRPDLLLALDPRHAIIGGDEVLHQDHVLVRDGDHNPPPV